MPDKMPGPGSHPGEPLGQVPDISSFTQPRLGVMALSDRYQVAPGGLCSLEG